MNLSALTQLNSSSAEVDICVVQLGEAEVKRESELDEMWSFVGKKANQRWLWHAIERKSGKVLAYVFGTRKDETTNRKNGEPSLGYLSTPHDQSSGLKGSPFFRSQFYEVFLQLKALLLPFGISRFYTDDWGAYKRHLDGSKHEIGKQNTQKIENKHLNLRAPD